MDSPTSPALAVDSFLNLEGYTVEPVTLSLTGNESTDIDPLALAFSLVGNTEIGVHLSLAESADPVPVDSVGADISSSRKQGQIIWPKIMNFDKRKRNTYQL